MAAKTVNIAVLISAGMESAMNWNVIWVILQNYAPALVTNSKRGTMGSNGTRLMN